MKNILLVFFLIFLLSCDGKSELYEYVPIVYVNDKGLVDTPRLLTEEHLNNLEYVLNFYKITFRRDAVNKLLIDSDVDRDTLWNYTTKANDNEWLNNHVK